jgi:hypothetical protein
MYRKVAVQVGLQTFCFVALMGAATAAQNSENAPPVAGVTPLGVSVAQTAEITPGYRASKLVHADVYNDQNQKIGKIGDLVIAPDGKLSVAVVDVGGFLGMGTHQVAIPVEQFSQIAPKLVLPGATKEALKSMPEFHYAA